jgi:hypothetical protein
MAHILGNLIGGLLTGLAVMALLKFIASGRFLRGLSREMPRTAAALRTAWHWLRVRPGRKRYRRRVVEAHQRMHDIRFWQARLNHDTVEGAVARDMLTQLPPLSCPCPEHSTPVGWPAPRLTDHEY